MKKKTSRRMKMSNRLALIYAGMIIVLIIIALMSYYRYNEHYIYRESISNLRQISDVTMVQIDSKLTRMEQTAVDVLADSRFMDAWKENLVEQTAENTEIIRQTLINAYKNKSDIRRVAAFDNNGNYYCTGIVNVEQEKLLEKIKYIQENYQLNQQNTRFFQGPSNDFWDTQSEGRVISEIKPIKNQAAEIIGYVEIQQNVFYLEKICSLVQNGYPLKVVVFMGDSDEVFFKNFDEEEEGYLEELAAKTKEYSKIKEIGDTVVCTASSNYYHGRAVFIMDTAVLTHMVWQMMKGILLVAAAMLVLTLTFVIITTKRIFTPINSLVVHMSKQDLNHFEGKLDVRVKDYETEVLTKSYEEMMQRLKDAIERQENLKNVQTKTLFSILQSEISPHFLYNTLGGIANMCQEGNAEAAAEACYDLSDILRYSSDYKTSEVTVQEEIRNLKAYLSLMKTRYRQRLEYEIFEDEEADYFCLPKLTLQPLVENGIKYSLTERDQVVIRIYVVLVGNELILEVKDNGCGISEEAVETIRQRLAGIHDMESLEQIANQIQIGGMGLSGTLIRLSIFFGENFSYQLTNSNDEDGTTIVIKINITDYR
ncbi:MAG: histidine kinase [Candidatus Limivivens sp.]|nr:histidine kinase [Candidatus Limivivens sp.]